jgi:hypothetical protein
MDSPGELVKPSAPVVKMPVWVMRIAAWIYRSFNRRMAELLRFIVLAATHACVAPTPGKRRLHEHFAERAKALQ